MADYAPVSCSSQHVQDSIKRKENLVYSKDGTLSSAQILALNGTPVSLVSAPGASKALIFEGLMLFYDYGTTKYTVDSTKEIAVRYTDGSGTIVGQVETEGFLDQTADGIRWAEPASTAYTPVANAALVAHMTTGEVTAGDSPVYYKILYRIVRTNLNGSP